MYLSTCLPGGVVVLDVSDIQSRKAVPMIRQIGSVSWNALSCAPHALPVTWNGKPYLIAPDEFDSEGIHIIDIADPTQPKNDKKIQQIGRAHVTTPVPNAHLACRLGLDKNTQH